jgi:hypothetical protein
MFEDFYNIKHQDLQIPDNYPTHPQAEILVFNPIPVRYIKNSTALAQWMSGNRAAYSQTFSSDPQYFQPRDDWKEWKPANFNEDGIPFSYFADDVDDDDDDIPF